MLGLCVIGFIKAPDLTSQSKIFSSQPPAANVWLSWLNDSERTELVCPTNALISFRDSMSQSIDRLSGSPPPEAKNLPSGLTARAKTSRMCAAAGQDCT